MAEIKSAVELAMERSKRFAISDQEREEIKRKEIQQKATGLFHRYIEGHLLLHEILKEIERMDEGTQAAVREILLFRCIDALSLGDEDERLLKGIESLKGRSLDDVRERLRHLRREYSEEKEKIEHKVKDQVAGELKRMGIYGSSVEPNITGNQTMKSLLETMDRTYREKVQEVKKTLRAL